MVQKKCKSSEIRNPATGRCVKRSGRIGKLLRRRKSTSDKPRRRKSTSDKAKRRKSAPKPRRRKSTSDKAKRRKSTSKRRASPKRRAPQKRRASKQVHFSQYDVNLLDGEVNMNARIKRMYGRYIIEKIARAVQEDVQVIRFMKLLGKGANGQVFMVYLGERQKYCIVKFQKYHGPSSWRNIRYEYAMQELFHDKKVGAPTPIFFDRYNNNGSNIAIIAMKLDPFAVQFGLFHTLLKTPLDKTILDYMLDSIEEIITKMCASQLIHGDFHWGNIGFQDMNSQSVTVLRNYPVNFNNRNYYVAPLVIDFGWATEGECMQEVEIVQLIRTLYPVFKSGYTLDNRNYLYAGLLELLRKLGSQIKFTQTPTWSTKEFNGVNQVHNKLVNKLRGLLKANMRGYR